MELTQFAARATANNVLVKLNVYYGLIPSHYTSILLDPFSLGNKKQMPLTLPRLLYHQRLICRNRVIHCDTARTISQRGCLKSQNISGACIIGTWAVRADLLFWDHNRLPHLSVCMCSGTCQAYLLLLCLSGCRWKVSALRPVISHWLWQVCHWPVAAAVCQGKNALYGRPPDW